VQGLQYRVCEDTNECGTEEDKPPEMQECEYIPTCSDGIQNCHRMPDGTLLCEEGVDCGGPCPPCPSCHDGIQNQGETGIDCGGPCAPCPSCHDRLKNCHRMPDGSLLCEEGIDCGGPCPPCGELAPSVERPALPGCGDGICLPDERCVCPADCKRFPWALALLLYVILMALFLALYGILKFYHRKSVMAKPVYVRRRIQLFIGTSLVAVYILVGVFYIYLFCACPPTCARFWYIPAALAGIVTTVVLELFHKLRYSKKRELRKLRRLVATHEAMLKKLMASENILIEDLEQDVIEQLEQTSDRRLSDLVSRVGELQGIHERLVKLTKLREQHHKSKVEDLILFRGIRKMENELATLIKAVREMKVVEEEQAAEKLRQQLELLQKFYDQKKTYFEKMDKMLNQYFEKHQSAHQAEPNRPSEKT
jgi:hypothetical protein